MTSPATNIRLSAALPGALAAAMLLCTGGTAHAHDRHDDPEYHNDHRRDERRSGGRLMIGLDMDYSAALAHSEIDQGGGGALRIGVEHDHFLVTLIPELQLDHHRFNADTSSDAAVSTAKVGGRIRLFKIIEPGIFAHAGLGHIAGDRIYEHTGIAFDAGFTLDLTILPLIDIGLHTAWNKIFGDPHVSYATAGAHIALVL